jgi:hypothetical protein
LRDQGWVVVVPNYTLFPNGLVKDMLSDISDVLHWTRENIADFNGDPSNVYLAGYSSTRLAFLSLLLGGAHLVALTVLYNAISQTRFDSSFNNSNSLNGFSSHIPMFTRPLPKLAGVVLISGVYDNFRHLVFSFFLIQGPRSNSRLGRIICIRSSMRAFNH